MVGDGVRRKKRGNMKYRFDMSLEAAAGLARPAVYHATFRDGAGGDGVGGPNEWKKLSGEAMMLENFTAHIILSSKR
nr:proteasome subunit beta type-5-B-like [Coffea arabica]